MKNNEEKLVKVLKALGDPNRLKIFKCVAGTEKMCACYTAKQMKITQPAISQHLKILKNAGLLKSEKVGLYVHYSVNIEMIKEFREELYKLLDIKEIKKCIECK